MQALASLALFAGASLLGLPSTALSLPSTSPLPEEPFLDLELPDAFGRAEAQDKLVLMFFHSEGESESRRMIKQTFTDEKVLKWIDEHAIPIQLDEVTHRGIIGRFGVSRYPCTQLRTADKRMLERMDFFHTPEEFLAAAKATLAGRSISARPDGAAAIDPYSWLAWGNYLFNNEGDATEMVRAYSWCLENGDRYEPGFRSRYLDFLLKRIAFAKRATPEAIRKLTIERNRLKGLVNTGSADDVQAHELVLFNFWMREEENTRQLFLDLAGQSAAIEPLRRVLMYHELEGLVAHRHYAELIAHMPDPLKEIRQRQVRMKQAEQRAEKMEKDVDFGTVVRGLPEARSQWVSDAAHLYEVLLHQGRGKDAAEMLDLVVTEVPTGRAFAIFMDKSTRLGLDDLTRRTGERGMKEVREGGARKIRTALLRLDKEPAERESEEAAQPDKDPQEGEGGGEDDNR